MGYGWLRAPDSPVNVHLDPELLTVDLSAAEEIGYRSGRLLR